MANQQAGSVDRPAAGASSGGGMFFDLFIEALDKALKGFIRLTVAQSVNVALQNLSKQIQLQDHSQFDSHVLAQVQAQLTEILEGQTEVLQASAEMKQEVAEVKQLLVQFRVEMNGIFESIHHMRSLFGQVAPLPIAHAEAAAPAPEPSLE